jgi:hypothetical protein
MNDHYTFLLEVDKMEVFLNLRKDGTLIEKVLVGDGRSLAEKLLPVIDTMLQKYYIKTEDIEKFEVTSDLPEGYSARRIAETVASMYRFGTIN